jgi:branched-chain amino acid transport system substrate-binding protein
VLRLVSSLPQKGTGAAQGRQMAHAIDLAIRERPTVAGYRIEHVTLEASDSETGEWTPAIERSNAQSAVDDPSVIAYIGPYTSGASAVSLPLTNMAGLLECGPSASWPGLTRPGWDAGEPDRYNPSGTRNFVRLIPPDDEQGAAAAQWAAREGKRHAVALHDGSSYSVGLARRFSEEAARLGIVTGETLAFDPERSTELAGSLKGIDAVFIAPSNVFNAAALATALAPTDISVYAADVALDRQFAEAVGASLPSWRIVSNRTDQLDEENGFRERFRGAYGEDPSQFAANAYVCAEVALHALEAVGSADRHAITEQIISDRSPSRPFDEAGDVRSWRMTGYTLRDGVFHSIITLAQQP